MPEPEIKRYEVVVPDTVVPDTYENITVKTTTGTEVKVNKKHAHLHQLFYDACEGKRAVKVGYAVYMNKEYVHTAELFDGKPPVGKQVEPITAGVGKKPASANAETGMTPEKWADKDRIQRRSIERQVSAKIAFEFTKATDIQGVLTNAEDIYQWISGKALSQAAPGEITVPEKGKVTLQMLVDKANEKGYDPTNVKAIMAGLFHAGNAKDLSQEQRRELYDTMDRGDYMEAAPEDVPF